MRVYGSFFVLLSFVGFCYAAAHSFPDDLKATGVKAVFPGDASYSGYDHTYNKRFNFNPAAITFPNNARQVAQVVKVGSAYKYPVVARSGGHSYIANGLGGKNGAVVIDLRNLKQITVSSSGIATIQTGNRLGNVALGLNSRGRALPHGTCPYVGIGGHSSYGGWGFTSRMWGLTLDTIRWMEVVLANGTITTITPENYDLFWAMRGAAPSFGVTTSISVQTFPAPSSAIIFQYVWNMGPSEAAKAVSLFQQFAKTNIPKEFGAEFTIGRGNPAGQLYFSLTGVYYGSAQSLHSTLAPYLQKVRQPDSTKITPGSYIESVQTLGGLGTLDTSAPDKGDTFYSKSLMTPSASPISDAALNAFMSYMANEGSQTDLGWFAEMDLYGGTNSAVNSVPVDTTAFGRRNALWTIQLYASSSNRQPPYPSSGFTFLNNMANSLTSNSPSDWDIGAYPNYPDKGLTNWQKLYYGSHYSRLQSIKRQYDPHNTFSFPQSIEL
ncbi:hypothetical protein APHAL10511_003196 [Amanita phalloides]|nr:hypothetical protein APHAL10511_003196 [Amanita phalloides]